MAYASEQNEKANQELLTLIDDTVRAFMAENPQAVVRAAITVLQKADKDMVDASHANGIWEQGDEAGAAYKRGFKVMREPELPLTRAERRRASQGR